MTCAMATKIVLDLSRELEPDELESFKAQARARGRSLSDHMREIAFGSRQLEVLRMSRPRKRNGGGNGAGDE